MPSNKNRLKVAKLYLILDAQVLSHAQLLKVLKESVRFNIDIVQLRDKFGSARDILAFCSQALQITKHRIPFIVNDRIDLALIAKADGVHVGQDDIRYEQARQLMGPKAIIGVSCQTLSQARQAQAQGADYIGFGSVFKTETKPERTPMNLKILSQVVRSVDMPVFAIGGINCANAGSLKEIGVNRIAVCRDILLAKNPGQVIQELKSFFSPPSFFKEGI